MMDLLTDIRFIIAVIICMCVIAVVLGICLYLRYRRDNEASPIGGGLSVEIGNAQIIGTREKQDDSFATSIMPYGVMAIVADGIGGYIRMNLREEMQRIISVIIFRHRQCCPIAGSVMNSEKPEEARQQLQ